jgi:hypothetical protein
MGHFTKDVNVKIAGYQQQKIVKITGEVVNASATDALSKNEIKKLDDVKKVKIEEKNGKAETKVKKS